MATVLPEYFVAQHRHNISLQDTVLSNLAIYAKTRRMRQSIFLLPEDPFRRTYHAAPCLVNHFEGR